MPLTHVIPDGAVNNFPEITQMTCIRRDRNGTIWVAGGADSSLWRSNGEKFTKFPDRSVTANRWLRWKLIGTTHRGSTQPTGSPIGC